MPIQALSILDADKISTLASRQSIFLDSNIWIDLIEAKNGESIKAKSLLLKLVMDGLVFCPVSVTNIFELFAQEYDSALRQAELMETLSLNVTFRKREEIWEEEIKELVSSFLVSHFNLPAVKLERTQVFAPVFTFLSSKMNLEFPAEAPASFINEVTLKMESELKSVGMVRIIEMHKSHLPDKDWKNNVQPEDYAEMLRNRRLISKGSVKRAREVEKKATLRTELLPLILSETKRLEPLENLKYLREIDAYLSSLGKDPEEKLLQKLPCMNRFIEILTETGLDDAIRFSSNHVMDIENMIIPPIYADVFVARDGWVKSIMSNPRVNATNKAKSLFSLVELISYCENLKT